MELKVRQAAEWAAWRSLNRRIGKLEGQLRGIAVLIMQDRPYNEVLVQIAALRGGLDSLALAAGEAEITRCVTEPYVDQTPAERAERLLRALRGFLRTV